MRRSCGRARLLPPSAELLAAARKEGKIVLYTANFLDTEQAVVKRFSQRFPGIAIEIVRAPTGQLITRVKTEAAANRLIADVVDFTDRVQARGMVELFAPYGAAERSRLSRGRAHDRPAVAALRQCVDDHLQLRACEGSAEIVADLVKPEFGRHRAGRGQALCRALSRHADRDRARADRPAHHAHQDRGRRPTG